jgi:phasin family protein
MNATLNAEQFVNANKTAFAEAQSLAATAFGGFERLVDLNMSVTKTVLFHNSTDFFAAFSANSPTDALAAQAALVKPLAEQSVAYAKAVYAIATETAAELTSAAEEKFAEGQKAVSEVVENLAKNAPAGSETIVAAFKSAVSAGQNAIDSAKTSAKKAMEVAEKQATDMTDSALNSVKTATTSRKK